MGSRISNPSSRSRCTRRVRVCSAPTRSPPRAWKLSPTRQRPCSRAATRAASSRALDASWWSSDGRAPGLLTRLSRSASATAAACSATSSASRRVSGWRASRSSTGSDMGSTRPRKPNGTAGGSSVTSTGASTCSPRVTQLRPSDRRSGSPGGVTASPPRRRGGPVPTAPGPAPRAPRHAWEQSRDPWLGPQPTRPR